MELGKVFFIFLVVVCAFTSTIEAALGKILVKAIKKAGQAIGKSLQAINVASTVHDIAKAFQPKKKHKKRKN